MTEMWKPIGDALESIKQKIIGWFMRNTFFAKMGNNGTGFLNCFLSIKTITTNLAVLGAVTKFFTTIAGLATPIGWVNLVINLVCGWQFFKMGIDKLKEAWKAVNAPSKNNAYGQMFGFFMKAVGGLAP